MRYAPPGRGSADACVTTSGPGASHCASSAASVHASNTSAAGAAIERTTTRVCWSAAPLTPAPSRPSSVLYELDEVSAGVVEHRHRHRSLRRRRLPEHDAARREARVLGADVVRRE